MTLGRPLARSGPTRGELADEHASGPDHPLDLLDMAKIERQTIRDEKPQTCKLNDVDPLGYLTDVLARIVNGHSNRDIDQLLPWAYRKPDLKAVA